MAMINDIVRLAEQRHHLVTVPDLNELGFTRRRGRRFVAEGLLFPVHHGVLSTVPGPFEFRTRAVAACLAVPAGVLSFSTAASLHGIRRVPRDWLDITVSPGTPSRLPLVHFHRSNALAAGDVIHWIDGLRLTTPARTLFDLAAVLDGPALRSAVEDARNRELVSDVELDEIGARLCGRGRPGSEMFRTVVAPLLGQPAAQSNYEIVVRDALVGAGLSPVSQYRLALPNGRWVYLDLALVDVRLAIEIDPALTHASAVAVQSDKARDVQVALAGWRTVRFTEQDVVERLRSVVGYVRGLSNLPGDWPLASAG